MLSVEIFLTEINSFNNLTKMNGLKELIKTNKY